MKIAQCIPEYMDVDGAVFSSFETTEELLNLPFVRRYRELVGFHRFAIYRDLLMAVSSDGLDWWVVGRLDAPEKVDLPKWELPLK